VLVTERSVRRRRYFEFTLPERTHPGSPEEVAGGLLEVMTTAVRDRLLAARKVGFTLSGGFDSSSIVGIARILAGGSGKPPLPTFSWYFSQTAASDERTYVQSVVAQGGLEPHLFDADALSPLAHVDEILAAVDEPFDGPHVLYRWAVARLAAELGIDVVLEGNGGDAVSPNGVRFLADLARRGRLVRLAREIRGLTRTLGMPPWRAVRKLVLEPNVPAFVRRLRRAAMGRTARYPAPPFVAPELARRTSLDRRLEEFWHRRPPSRNEREHHLRNLVDHLPGNVFELTYASFAVEPRFPFTDRRVIEYCLAVPSAQKIENGMTRMLTRRAFAGLLPPAINARTRKANPSPSFTRRLFEADRPLLDDAFSAPAGARVHSYLDLPALRDACERCASWSRSHPGEQPPLPLWREVDQLRKAVVLVRWLRSTGIEE
jgi:asparagine synthase (glutamine-hydrolysing)